MSEKLFCSHCGAEIDRDEMFEFDGAVYCACCIDELTTLCDCCNTRIRRGDVHGDGETELCGSCYDSYYTTCEDCGVLLHNDDAYFDDDNDYPYCHSCYEKLQQASIKSYNYKPEPIFYGESKRYFGVELEFV